MKKSFIYLSFLILGLILSACGNRNNQNPGTATDETTDNLITVEQQESTDVQTPEDLPETGTSENTLSKTMEVLKNAVVTTLGENYWPNMTISPEVLEGTYGVSADWYDDYMGESPMISANVDTLIIIQAKEDQVKVVEAALNAYRDAMISNTNQYPMNIGKIQASRIEVFGNYVCFVQLGADVPTLADGGQDAVIRYCQEQNELALEVIGRALNQ